MSKTTLPPVGTTTQVEIINRADPRWGQKLTALVTAHTPSVYPGYTEVEWTTNEVDYLGNKYEGAMGYRTA